MRAWGNQAQKNGNKIIFITGSISSSVPKRYFYRELSIFLGHAIPDPPNFTDYNYKKLATKRNLLENYRYILDIKKFI